MWLSTGCPRSVIFHKGVRGGVEQTDRKNKKSPCPPLGQKVAGTSTSPSRPAPRRRRRGFLTRTLRSDRWTVPRWLPYQHISPSLCRPCCRGPANSCADSCRTASITVRPTSSMSSSTTILCSRRCFQRRNKEFTQIRKNGWESRRFFFKAAFTYECRPLGHLYVVPSELVRQS